VALAEITALKEKLEANQRLMDEMNRSWEEKLELARKNREENALAMEAQGALIEFD
jgi:hypothetical protein